MQQRVPALAQLPARHHLMPARLHTHNASGSPAAQIPTLAALVAPTLLGRCFREALRRRSVLATMIVQNIIMGVLIGTVFLQIGTGQSSTTRRQPVLFFCVINQGIFAALVTINMFPAERVLSLRERAAGTYYASAYYLAKTTADVVLQLPSPIIFSCVVYWLVGFQPVAAKFFTFMAFMVLCTNAATSLAVMVSALARTTDMSVTILPITLEVARLFGGFFLPPVNLPAYFKWLDALSYAKYAYTGISLNELTGLAITCNASDLVKNNGVCPITSGEQTISSLGLNYVSMTGAALVLVAFAVFCRVVGYLGIRYIKW